MKNCILFCVAITFFLSSTVWSTNNLEEINNLIVEDKIIEYAAWVALLVITNQATDKLDERIEQLNLKTIKQQDFEKLIEKFSAFYKPSKMDHFVGFVLNFAMITGWFRYFSDCVQNDSEPCAYPNIKLGINIFQTALSTVSDILLYRRSRYFKNRQNEFRAAIDRLFSNDIEAQKDRLAIEKNVENAQQFFKMQVLALLNNAAVTMIESHLNERLTRIVLHHVNVIKKAYLTQLERQQIEVVIEQ